MARHSGTRIHAAGLAVAVAAALAGTPATGAHHASVDALLAALTLDEKLSFVHGAADPQSLGQAGYIPGVPRLGIPPLRLTDGPAGVRVTHPSTAMPAPVALASTFDPTLARRYGEVIGRDGRALGLDVLLSPMVNTIRVPYAGRNFETFSEDPLVSAGTVAPEVRGIQSQGLVATVKHYAENNQEQDRMSVDVRVGEQALREVELAGFEAAVRAGTGAVMCSYNKINGDPGCGSAALLDGILKGDWGFPGWVMSDWGATHSTGAIATGLDQEMPSGTFLGAPLKTAVQQGTIPQSTVDAAVRRILVQMKAFGLLACASPAGPVAGCQLPPRPAFNAEADNRVALAVAESGSVLLRDVGNALPLTGPAARSIALIGTPARYPVIGGGGSSQVTPVAVTTPLDEITRRAGRGAAVSYAPGIDTIGALVPASALSGGSIDLTGSAALPNGQSFVTTRTLTVTTAGDYLVDLQAAQGIASLALDGTPVASGFALSSALTSFRATVHLTAGAHTLGINVFSIPSFLTGPLQVRLTWVTPEAAQADLDAAVAAARAARTAVVFAYDEGTEGADRSTLALPYRQDRLVEAVAAANPDTVVVLNTGSAVTMPWLSRVRGVLDMYYPGQMGGLATARLLFGDAGPGGRLTQTFPLDDAHTMVSGDPARYPGVNLTEQYSEGVDVGYRWYDAQRQAVLFPFGYGLSYTSFGYRGLRVGAGRDGLTVRFRLTNTGRRAGDEVAQVYLGPSPDVHSAQQPVRALAGYQKVHLAPGESRDVTLTVPLRQLQYWDSTAHAWALGTGTRTVWVGSSSAALPLAATVTVGRMS
ncbi:MAG TPA: glycoside hydrolase family 3 C-terminal domain-containing protein [Rugosimonospora sp.]|nr:glycoside hydrolase family 3 C-terminal domain-containing protein [Rugosimonospora sp.]